MHTVQNALKANRKKKVEEEQAKKQLLSKLKDSSATIDNQNRK